MFPLDPSDIVLIADLALAVTLALYFAIGRPRVWFRDRLGWVIFSYALALIALLVLIVYGIVFGQKIVELVRLSVSLLLAGALIAKIRAVNRERHAGRLAGERPPSPEGNGLMAESTSAIKAATTIWFSMQRVLRTIVQAGVPAFLSFALVLPMVIDALGLPVDSELRLWLLGLAAGVTAVAAALARLMAIPAVNAWLVKVGLGSVPKDAIVALPATGTVTVKPDVKALKNG